MIVQAQRRPPSVPAAKRLPKPVPAGFKLVCVALWIGCVALGLAVVARQTEIARLGYQTAADAAATERQREENDRLAAQVAYLESPARIYHIATTRLGMKRPDVVVAAIPPARTAEVATAAATSTASATGGATPAAAQAGGDSLLGRMGRAVVEVLAGPLRAEARGR